MGYVFLIKNDVMKDNTERKVLLMPRRGECIYKRKDGRWEARYVKSISADGKKKYGSVYAGTYREVKDKQQCHMLIQMKKKQCSVNVCISELMIQWLNYTEPRVKKSTYLKYEGISRNHIVPHLGNIPLVLVTRASIEAFAADRSANGRVGGGRLSQKTVNDILIVLGLAFDFAQEEYDIVMPRVSLVRDVKKEARVLSVDEQNTLVKYLLTDMNEFKFGVLLALYTGLRIGELCALQWDDITDCYVKVNKTMQRLKSSDNKTEVVIGETKSESSMRNIPLPEFLRSYVARFRKSSGYIMRTSHSVYMEPRTVQIRFNKMVKKLNLEDVTFHTLRHSFATRCVEAGFDVKTLSEILGHSDVKTTLNRYVHSSFALKQNNMEKLSLVTKL